MRVKRGKVKNRKHKKVLKNAKGYRLSYSKLYRRAKEALLHAGAYNFAHRRRRRSQFRQQWIKTISAALTGTNFKYSQFIHALKENDINIDRKNLANMILTKPDHFEQLVETLA